MFFSCTLPAATVRLCSGEDICNMEGFTVDTRVEDLRHVWIPLTLKMSISKSQGLEISSWPEGEEVRRSTPQCTERNSKALVSSCFKKRGTLPCSAECSRGGRWGFSLRPGGHGAPCIGCTYGREPDRTHQSGGDVPSEERGETRAPSPQSSSQKM